MQASGVFFTYIVHNDDSCAFFPEARAYHPSCHVLVNVMHYFQDQSRPPTCHVLVKGIHYFLRPE